MSEGGESACFVIHSLHRGGAERATVNLAGRLVALGWRVTIATLAAESRDAYELAPGVDRAALAGAGVSRGPLQGLVANVARARDLRRVLRRERCTFAIGMSSSANVLVGLACLGTSVTAIGSERVHPPMEPTSRLWSLARRHGYAALDGVVCLTEETAAWIRARTRARRTVVVPNGVELPLASGAPHVAPPQPGTGPLVLAVGRLVPQKRFDVLVRAFAAAAGPRWARRAGWQLAILGTGPERGSLLALAGELGVAERVRLVGDVGNPGDWYARADLFALSSRYEGFPNALLEAMAHGCASIACDCPTGPRDLIDSGVDGVLVAADDTDAFAAAMARLMDDDAARARLGTAAASVRDTHSMAAVGDRWRATLQRWRR